MFAAKQSVKSWWISHATKFISAATSAEGLKTKSNVYLAFTLIALPKIHKQLVRKLNKTTAQFATWKD